jgi:glycosyltransferase involved in cell wall biosynthesis
MIPKIDLFLWVNPQSQLPPIDWPLGSIQNVEPTIEQAWQAIEYALDFSTADFWLFWDKQLGQPDIDVLMSLVQEPIDIWHAGLLFGLAGEPQEMDYISPTWPLNRDVDPKEKAVSWRMSLRACLIQIQVLKELGQIDRAFETLDAAALEMGYRYIWKGAVMVHDPKLVKDCSLTCIANLSLRDRYTFFIRQYKTIWQKYLLLRRILASQNLVAEIRAYREAFQATKSVLQPGQPDHVLMRLSSEPNCLKNPKISVLIPTLCRYTYLKATLEQLKEQTLKPLEVICVDQTPLAERQIEFYEGFQDLNLKVIWKDEPGQCSARNSGLAQIQNDLILFLDDDVIVGPEYIQSLVKSLDLYQADIAVGVWSQDQEQAISPTDRCYRISDRFATGNSLARREVIQKMGGFDVNYDRNYRADADLGMRLYLAGTISIITPFARENSLSPPIGGLKFFGASDGSRRIKLLQPWPAVTQTYYWMRYFTKTQVRESFLLNLIATAISRKQQFTASFMMKILLVLSTLWTIPFRIFGAWLSIKLAKRMLEAGPKIPDSKNGSVMK